MEPMSIAIGGAKALGKVLVQKIIKEQVVDRWTRHRAERFQAAFLEEIAREHDEKWLSANLSDLLHAVGADDGKSSLLFEAYRRVALSASKDMGPMIIALLTARIIRADRQATDDEELIFEAAESLRDKDFKDLDAWLTAYCGTPDNPIAQDYGVEVVAKTGPFSATGAVSMSQLQAGDQSPLDLAQDVGLFAVKLRQLGLLSESIRRRRAGSPGADEYLVVVTPACMNLHQLAKRARQAMPSI